MKNLFAIFIFFFSCPCYGQNNCDSSTIEQIINMQLKIADKWFDRPYVVIRTSMPIDLAKSYIKSDTTYIKLCFGSQINWSDFSIGSKYGKVETETDNREYSLDISNPVFNEDLTKCKVIVSSHFTEFACYGRLYDFVKRGKKWKVARSNLLFIQ